MSTVAASVLRFFFTDCLPVLSAGRRALRAQGIGTKVMAAILLGDTHVSE